MNNTVKKIEKIASERKRVTTEKMIKKQRRNKNMKQKNGQKRMDMQTHN